jgi:hypothetical protein
MSTPGILGTPNSMHYSGTMILTINIHKKTSLLCKGILLFFFSILTSNSFSQDYNFRNFNSEDGLAQSIVENIMQNKYVIETQKIRRDSSLAEFAEKTLQTQPYNRFRYYEMLNAFVSKQI